MSVRFRGRLEPFLIKACQKKAVNLVPDPARVTDSRQFGLDGNDIGPVLRIGGPLSNPLGQQVNFLSGEFLARVKRWHGIVRVATGDACDQLTVIRFARHDRSMSVEIPGRALRRVDTQFGLSLGVVRAVALVALVRQDRPNVAIEVDLLRRRVSSQSVGSQAEQAERRREEPAEHGFDPTE